MKPLPLLLFLLMIGSACLPGSTPESRDALVSEHFFDFHVYDEHGDRVGVVESTIIDLESDAIRYAVIQVRRRGFPYGKASMVASAETLVPVPWEMLSPELAKEKLVLSADIAMVEEAPDFDIIPDELDGEWDTRIRNYWQVNKE